MDFRLCLVVVGMTALIDGEMRSDPDVSDVEEDFVAVIRLCR